LTEGEHLLAAMSRYAKRSVPWPPGSGSDRRQVDFLLQLNVKHHLQGWMLLPTDDAVVALISHHHEELARQYRVTVPPWDLLRWVCDKRLLYRLAKELAIAQPWTACPRTREELASLHCPFPVVLKPAMRLDLNRFTAAKAWRADDRSSLLARYDEACALVPPDMLMVQELVPGWGEAQFSYAALCQDGVPLASVVARRARQYPMDFGRFSTYVETIEEPDVVEPAVRMLAATRFTGLVEIEFKRDPRDGQFKVLDINPRVWGWHTLSRRAGVDFPYLLWLLVSGEPVPKVCGRAGERWMRMPMDLPMAIHEIWNGRLSLRAYVRSLLGPTESAILAWDDPLPGLLDAPLLAWMLGRRVLGGKGM
jgi:predicted ATP-grasp superfamily ATP-dependent carboligase